MTTIVVTLAAETERKLRAKAESAGVSLEAYLQRLAERDAANGVPSPASFEEATRPFAQAVEAAGMSEQEVAGFFAGAVKEARAERRARK